MSFDGLLTHTVRIMRTYATGTGPFDSAFAPAFDGQEPDIDEYGQPITEEALLATVRAAIQPKATDEATLTTQAGPALGDHMIFLRPTDLTTADAIVHDPAVCGLTNDLPDGRYEVIGVPFAAGLGHHLEVEAKRVDAPAYAGAPL
jgi:hypothetical protein